MKKEQRTPKNGRIILVNPDIQLVSPPRNSGMFPANGIQILGTILHQNQFDVHIVDGRYLSIDDATKQILSLISDDVIFIGFSVMTVQVKWAHLASQRIKKVRPDVKIVWGGVHPTLFPEQTALDNAVDFCVVNECAHTIVQIANALAKNGDFPSVPGLCYADNGGVYRSAPNQIPDDFSNIPYIDFSIMNHQLYSRNNNIAADSSPYDEYGGYIVYPLNASIGCNFRCKFCINVILNRRYKMRSAQEIVERIKYLQSEYGANYIHMVDENFFGNKRRIYEFVELIRSQNIKVKWRTQLRADYFNRTYINESFVKELEKAGMVIAVMGVESASQETLDSLDKGLKVESITNAVEILSKTKIVPRLSFMVGLPGETEEGMKKTYEFAVKLEEEYPRCQTLVTPFHLYPGSELYDFAVSEYGFKAPGSLIEWVEIDEKEYSESFGYQQTKNYPWVKDASRFDSRHKTFTMFRMTSWSFSPDIARRGLRRRIKHFIKQLLYKASVLRIRKDFYGLNIEYGLLELWQKYKRGA